MPCEIYQLAPQTHTQMMGYVIKTPGDSLIVIDGGTAGDADYLLYLLRRLGVRRHAIAKDGTYRITLDGGNIDIFCADPFAAQ